MKTHSGGHVHLEIGVVHPVEPPKHRDVVKEAVLQVNRQVEQEQREQQLEPHGQGEHVEESPASFLGKQGEAYGSSRGDDAAQHGVEHRHANVAWPAPCPGNRPFPS